MDDVRKLLAIKAAEKQIQNILLDLVNTHGAQIEQVDVDTRQHANMGTHIAVRGMERLE